MPTAWDQTQYRFRNDDGSEAAASWKWATNNGGSLVVDANLTLRIRFTVKETGTTAAVFTGYLRMQRNGAGGYIQVNATSTYVKSVASPNVADDAVTTQQLSSPTTFEAGKYDEVDGICAATASVAQNAVTEVEFCVQITASEVARGDTLDFEVYKSSSAACNAYTSGAGRITILKTWIVAAGLAVGTSSGFAAVRRKVRAAGLATSAASAFVGKVVRGCTAGLALSASSAFAAGRVKVRPVGVALSASSAFAAGRVKACVAGLASSVSEALAATVVVGGFAGQVVVAGLALSSGVALVVGRAKVRVAGLAVTAGEGLSLLRLSGVALARKFWGRIP